ncbi:hypothetical protein SEUCBS139899_010434 [Sporothrix eucalyptigena]|uniref:Metallo-beta-lactamase domain-containing protein n=1 Tax=Sporothrix eucalyptigena TaxID=1812306 RepID=A0ABP0CP33_9PEZI
MAEPNTITDVFDAATLEWFGATTFRLRVNGLTLFLDSWLERPSTIPTYLKIDEVTECDYIFISHAHFDHLPGANKLALQTGATIVGNGEAITVMRAAGVPEAQLIAVSGGERIPLFTAEARKKAAAQPPSPPGPPAPGSRPPGPPLPYNSEAVMSVQVWPSLHCLMVPGEHPEFIDTATSYIEGGDDEENKYACTIDITRALTYGLGALAKLDPPPTKMPDDLKVFLSYLKDSDTNRFSYFDGGQLMYNFLIGEKTLLWSGHLGGYSGILQNLEPKPDVAILGIAGRANLDGRPWQGSAAEFAVQQVKWLGEPTTVIWCLHDRGPLKPYYIDTKAATEAVQRETASKVIDLECKVAFNLW